MENKKAMRTRFVRFRVLPEEFNKLESGWKKTTVRKLSEYLRRLIFNKPFTTFVRNKSLDDLMAELILLRKELNAIGTNFNQAVHRLHTLDHLPQMQLWLQAFERDKDLLFRKADEIKMKINLISDQWLQ